MASFAVHLTVAGDHVDVSMAARSAVVWVLNVSSSMCDDATELLEPGVANKDWLLGMC